jgi:S-adenosyl-L-methionine hydrolase (adenosine-forming)
MTRTAAGVSLVTFLSDFGTDDAFVGLCHAALLAAGPQVRVVDLSHTVRPQDVLQGAARLADAVPWTPRPAVHLAVVDPGVGTERAGLAIEADGSFLVGPDNGLLLPAARRLGGVTGAWRLTVPAGASATFHGRDVFSPAAGRLAAGADPASLGVPVDPDGLVACDLPAATVTAGHVAGPVRDIDRFGNLQLWVRPSELVDAGLRDGGSATVRAGVRAVPARRVRTFGELQPGAMGVIEDAFGWVAVVCAGGSAARALDVDVHAPLTLATDVTGEPPWA